jgi:hypothetical protein
MRIIQQMPAAAGLFYLLSALTVLSIVLAIYRSPRWYWAAALLAWAVSFLGGFSIGLYTLVLAFVFLALALAYQFRLIKTPWMVILSILLGVIVWAVLVAAVDDYWLFLPMQVIFEALFSLLGPVLALSF